MSCGQSILLSRNRLFAAAYGASHSGVEAQSCWAKLKKNRIAAGDMTLSTWVGKHKVLRGHSLGTLAPQPLDPGPMQALLSDRCTMPT